MNVLEPVYVYRNDSFWRIPEEMIQSMAKGYDETGFRHLCLTAPAAVT